MKRATVIFVELPERLWTTWPQDRPFAALAGDAMSCERRIRKGVNLGRERARYTQLCSWIELSALQLLHEGKVQHSFDLSDMAADTTVPLYLSLIECLQTYPDLLPALRKHRTFWEVVLSWFEPRQREQEGASRPHPLGKTFFPPGAAVHEQQEAFNRITPKRLKAIAPELPDDQLTPFADLARRKAAFYRAAHGRRSGVVEILATRPS